MPGLEPGGELVVGADVGLELLGEADAVSAADEHGEPVAQAVERLGEATGQDHEDDQQPDTGDEDLVVRELVAEELDEGDAGEGAADRVAPPMTAIEKSSRLVDAG